MGFEIFPELYLAEGKSLFLDGIIAHGFGEVILGDNFAFAHNQQSFHQVAQFPDIPFPFILPEQLDDFVGEFLPFKVIFF
ncbi:MAG: hypothetical protein NT166_01995 [Candidatus Aminicenantes bacterium]|nr:hypothetical protein [Candidatus Aminicenantes bacterium]